MWLEDLATERAESISVYSFHGVKVIHKTLLQKIYQLFFLNNVRVPLFFPVKC